MGVPCLALKFQHSVYDVTVSRHSCFDASRSKYCLYSCQTDVRPDFARRSQAFFGCGKLDFSIKI